MAEVIPDSLDIHGYADDHAIKTSFRSGDLSVEKQAFKELEDCLAKIRNWMNENRLKMNDSKTEFIVFAL